jgi:protocatechuate 3,4-dioxygenase beta subunit
MKNINANKSSVIYIALVIILASTLVAGCGSQPPASTSAESTQSGSAATPTVSGVEEPTLPPIPTVASVHVPTSMSIVIGGNSPTATATPPAGDTQVTCNAPAALTPEETEGPYFKAGSPETANLYQAGMAGTKMILTGYVLTTDCKPVAHALLDFWQADSDGQYDNNGYTLRGHQYTDESGKYQLVTVVPGLYPGRTEHIHVKVQAPNGPVLTTQLYFPDVQANQSDTIFNPALAMTVQETADGLQAQFNFVVTP